MGMFDWLKVHEKWLCDDEPTDGWQTKDLDNRLAGFDLDEHGYLIEIESIFKEFDNVEKNPKIKPYTGFINLYTSIKYPLLNDQFWREYKAEFINGKLITINRVNE